MVFLDLSPLTLLGVCGIESISGLFLEGPREPSWVLLPFLKKNTDAFLSHKETDA